MGLERYEWKTPKKARFFDLLERDISIPAVAKELQLDRITAWRWTKKRDATEIERRTRSLSQKIDRPRIITDKYINQMILWITGYFDRRILPLQTIAKEACGITASERILLRAWVRWRYHHHTPDTKPFLTAAQKLRRYTFAIQNWDRPVEY